MTIVTNTFWTFARKDDTCTLRQYKTRTRLFGDQAEHVDCKQTESLVIKLHELPEVLVRHNIDEFTDPETAEWLTRM